MRELTVNEIDRVSGGDISGYQGAGAILAVLGAGALAANPVGLSAIVLGIGFGAAAGLAGSQFLADVESW